MKVGGETPFACLRAPLPLKPSFAVPAGSWDVHAHVIGVPPTYPWGSARSYDPPEASIEDYVRHLDTLGLAYGVLVQISVHGTDNRALLDGLRACPDRLRGVVGMGEGVTDAELRSWHDLGVRGVRISTVVRGGVPLDAAVGLAKRIAPLGWHVEFALHGDTLVSAEPLLRDFPTPIVIAHFGDVDVTAGTDGPQFRTLLGLVETGNCYVKLSAAYRLSAHPWTALDAFARRLIAARPDRMLWGSDWPHVALTDRGTMPDAARLLELVPRWAPSASDMRLILADNPARLYGVPGSGSPPPVR